MRDPASELTQLAEANLLRGLRTLQGPQGAEISLGGGKLQPASVVNFSSNDYLGLANCHELKNVLSQAALKHGAGSGASRLVSGGQQPHTSLEAALAEIKGTEAALAFSSGYAAAVGTLTALATAGDVIILDKLCHASLIDGARLSGATLRVFPHNNVDKLADHLAWAMAKIDSDGRVIVVTESIFSMDGDAAPLQAIANLTAQHGAWLMVDEAHAFGLFGSKGTGLVGDLKLADAVDVQLGTLSKAAGLSGGFVAAKKPIIDLLVNKARSFIYSTAPPPCLAAAADWVVREFLPSMAGQAARQALWTRVRQFCDALSLAPSASAIVPIILGEESKAMAASAALLEQGFLVPAIRYPTVARGAARLRITLTANHTENQVIALANACKQWL